MSDPVIFRPDRATYWRSQAWIAAAAMAGGLIVLWLMGNPHVWTGAIGGLAAISLRAWYLESEELAVEWVLDGQSLSGPAERRTTLSDIAKINRMGSTVQLITRSGDKHLIKYLADPEAVRRTLDHPGGPS